MDGWREIARYLARDERTAKRWEKQRGMPVRRIPGDGRANVYALRSEIEGWLRQGRGGEIVAGAAGEMPAADEGLAVGAGNEVEETVSLAQGDGSAFEPEAGAEPETGTSPEVAAGVMEQAGPGGFRPSQHMSLLVSLFGLVLLLGASAVRFFHVGPLERILLASESVQMGRGSRAAGAEADRLYLQGVYLTEQRTPDSLEGARRTFEQAIAEDPEFAPNYAGLARAFLLLREYGKMPDAVAYDRAKGAAEQALAHDPKLAEAHAALGFISFFWKWQAPEGEREFQRAMELEPGDALAHHWYGSMLMHQGRYPEAIAQLDEAQHLRPTSTAILATKALAIGFSGRKDEAVAMLRTLEGAGEVRQWCTGTWHFLAWWSRGSRPCFWRRACGLRRAGTMRQGWSGCGRHRWRSRQAGSRRCGRACWGGSGRGTRMWSTRPT